MLKSLIFGLVVLVSGLAHGGEGRINHSFRVNRDSATVAAWLDQHRDEVAASTNCQLVSRSGNLIRVRRNTLKGTLDFTLRETLAGNSYRLDFVKSHRGRLTAETTIVTFSGSANGTTFSIFASATVDGVLDSVIRAGLSSSVRGFERMMQSRF